MRAVWMWSRSDARRRVATLVGLALLITLAGGATLASWAGARRSATALDRMRARTLSMDAAVFGDGPATRPALRDPHVAASAAFWIAAVTADADPDLFPFVAPADDAIGRSIERPIILEGRRADPRRVDEIVLPEAVAARVHKDVGDRMRFRSVGPEDVDTATRGRPIATGPRFAMRVVGISRSPAGLSVRARDLQFTYFTRAWSQRYEGRIGALGSGSIVRLRGGQDAFGAWSRGANPDASLEAQPTPLFSPAPVEDSISVIVDGLGLFALVAAVAGLVAVVQALERHASGSTGDLDVLRGLGIPRGGRATASILAVLPAIVAGTAGAGLVALAWSPFMPIGLARRAEPDRGWSFDGVALGLGTLGVLVLCLLVAAVVAWRTAARRTDRADRRDVAHRMGALPPVAAVGVRLATRRGRGRDLVPVRSAVVGVATAIAGVIAVGGFAAGLHRLVDESARYGVPWDASVTHGNNEARPGDEARVRAVPEVAAVAVVRANLQGLIAGRSDGAGVALVDRRGAMRLVVRSGRAPVAADEIALGRDSARRLGLRRGDHVRLTGTRGSRDMLVVGEALLPTVDDPATLASGFMVTRRAERDLGLDGPDAFARLVVTFRPDVSRAEGVAALRAAGFRVDVPAPPPEVARLREVESLPRALALILALIGGVVMVLALVVTVRRRGRDLALLRVFGFTRRQVMGAVLCQAAVFAALGLVVGIPLGWVLGRTVWQNVAGALGVRADAAFPAVVVAATVVGVLVVAMLAAVTPASRAARLRPATILRRE